MREIVLRDYQTEAIDACRREIAAGVKNIILCAPTGSGKTVIASELMRAATAKFSRSLFLVDRLALLDQTSQVFDDYGIAHGIIQGDHWRHRPYERVQICSQQTLARRAWPEADLIIVDEAHTVTETVKQRISKRDCVTIGLTATPFTRGLGKLYDALVNVTTTDTLIRTGFLSNYRIFAASEPDMTGVKVVAGEWDEHETSERAMQVVGDCVVEYIKHGAGQKFICSAVDVRHCEALHEQFLAAGVTTAMYTYAVSDEECQEIVKEFRKPDSYIRGLITVTKASKGFDVPDLGVVIMARPLRKSVAEHIQLFGRGLRSHPGKSECLVLDHSGNMQRFWEDWTSFFATGATELDDGKKREKPKAKEGEDNFRKCPTCACLHGPAPFCSVCGHEYPKREPVRHVAGTLAELIASGDRRQLTTDLWPHVAAFARQKRADDERARRLAMAIYKELTDTWPMVPWERTPHVSLDPKIGGKCHSTLIRWAHRRKREDRVAA